MYWNGNCTRHWHDGGVDTRRIWGTSANAEYRCIYGLEVPNIEHESGSQYKVGYVPTYVNGCKRVLCKHLLDQGSEVGTRCSSSEGDIFQNLVCNGAFKMLCGVMNIFHQVSRTNRDLHVSVVRWAYGTIKKNRSMQRTPTWTR